jgi:hypothetical protein
MDENNTEMIDRKIKVNNTEMTDTKIKVNHTDHINERR